MSLSDKIDSLTDDQVFEVARAVLPDLVGVYAPEEALARAAEELALSEEEARTLRVETQAAAANDPAEIAALLRLALYAASEQGNEELVVNAVEESGKRMTVVGIDLILLGAFLLIGYVAIRTDGKQEDHTITSVENYSDGRVKVTIERKTKYLDPLSSIGILIKKYLITPS